jgi:hypothetical protein
VSSIVAFPRPWPRACEPSQKPTSARPPGSKPNSSVVPRNGPVLAQDHGEDQGLAVVEPALDARKIGLHGRARRREPPAVGVLVNDRVAEPGQERVGVARLEQAQRDRPVAVGRLGDAQRRQAAVP